jgi:hypothetical protein
MIRHRFINRRDPRHLWSDTSEEGQEKEEINNQSNDIEMIGLNRSSETDVPTNVIYFFFYDDDDNNDDYQY